MTTCEHGFDCFGHVTVRERRPDEKPVPFWGSGKSQPIPRYVVVDADNPDRYLGGFGLIDGGPSKGKALYWGHRFAEKNGYTFIRPPGWEKVRVVEP